MYDEAEVESMSNNEKYRFFLSHMEAEVVGLMGKEGKEMEALMGRGEGPKFALRCAMEEEVAGARKTSAVSRAWRRSAGWLSDILRTRNMVEAKWRKRKVAAYQHPPPDRFKATPQQMESFAKFKSWQDAVSEPLLANRTWVLALRDMALANAEKEERAAQRISMMKWIT